MIIGLSGKIGAGKDLVGKIIQGLVIGEKEFINGIQGFLDSYEDYLSYPNKQWEIKKFAGKLKQIVALLTGCTVEDLESQEFKNKQLPAEWDYVNKWLVGNSDILGNYPMNVEIYKDDEIFKGNPKRFTHHYTYRDLLQKVGTEALRERIHENVWVNSLMADYKEYHYADAYKGGDPNKPEKAMKLPNWIITDMRFPNEMKAVKDKGGITIRVSRDLSYKYTDEQVKDKLIEIGYRYLDTEDFSEDAINEGFKFNENLKLWNWDEDLPIKEHLSETALDDAIFDYVVDNNSTIEELVEKVKEILIKEKII